MENRSENKMGVERVPKLLITMSLPIMVSMFIQALYNIVDSIFVAKISENALTAVSLAFPIQQLIIAFAVGTAVGLNSLISRRLGERRQEEADAAAGNGMFLAVVTWLLFALFGAFFSRLFFQAFTDVPEIVEMGTQYIAICTILSIGVFVQITCERILQAGGNTIYPMLMQGAGAIINIVFDPILIFGWLGFPRMGVAGAAAATVLGQLVAMGLSLYFVLAKEHAVKLRFRGFRPNGRIIRDIYAVGFPAIIMQSIGSVMTIGLNKILILFSETAVSVLGVYFKLQSFVFMPVFGLSNGAMPIMGYNYGARNRKRLLEATKYGILYAVIIMAVGMAVFLLFPKQLLLLFDASEHMLQIGVPALRTMSLCFLFAAAGILCSTFFQATGHGMMSLLVSATRQLILILPVAYLLAMVSGLDALWYAFPISECFSLLLSCGLFLYVYRRDVQHLENRAPLPAKEG